MLRKQVTFARGNLCSGYCGYIFRDYGHMFTVSEHTFKALERRLFLREKEKYVTNKKT